MSFIIQEIPSPQTEAKEPTAAEGNLRRPEWLKAKVPGGEQYARLHNIMRVHKLHTVCEEARCPNMGECWNAGTATFMILGDTCSRSCGFCNVKTGRPTTGLDWDEPRRVADAAKLMKLRHVVITSVNRDEREDGGAPIFSETIRLIRECIPECKIEVLIPDFRGIREALDIVLDAKPDVLNHNIETIEKFYLTVRPQAKYDRSLEVLRYSKQQGAVTKTGIMVGLGETNDEVLQSLRDVRSVNCDIMTIGQYLQPTKNHLPIRRWVTPEEFAMFRDEGLKMGFRHVESGPLVRSSYHAEKHV